MLCNVSRPLDRNSKLTDALYKVLHEFQLRDIPVIDQFVPLPLLCTVVKDRLFIHMEGIQGCGNELKLIGINAICLNTVSKVHQRTNCCNKLRRGSAGNYPNEVTLNVMVYSTSDLFSLEILLLK